MEQAQLEQRVAFRVRLYPHLEWERYSYYILNRFIPLLWRLLMLVFERMYIFLTLRPSLIYPSGCMVATKKYIFKSFIQIYHLSHAYPKFEFILCL
jgi:hypothetical protein